MTIINQKSISGITSITTAAAGDNLLTVHTNDGTERLRIDSSGNTRITAGIVTTLTTTGNATVGGTLGVTGETTFSTHVNLGDNNKAKFGDSDDLQIYHDSSNSWISDDGTGSLKIRSVAGQVQILGTSSNDNMAVFTVDGAAELYYDNSKKLETKTDGIDITGEVQCDSLDVDGTADISGNLNLGGELGLLGTSDSAKYLDVRLGSNAFTIRGTSGGDTNHETMAVFTRNGSVDLYYDATKKFETKSDGVDITGELQCDSLDVDGGVNFDAGKIVFDTSGNNLKWADSIAAYFGNGNDLRLYHDGTHSYIRNAGTGNIKVLTTSMVVKNAADTEIMLQATQNGSVDLYYDNSKKFETLTNGVRAQGGILFGSDTAAANALDDYEEGTWTPSMSSIGQSGSFTYGTRNGFYTKIGRVVHVIFRIAWSAIPGTGGIVMVTNLPFAFTSTAGSGSFGGSPSYYNGLNATGAHFLGTADGGGSRTAIKFYENGTTAINVSTGNNISSSGDIRASFSYMVDL